VFLGASQFSGRPNVWGTIIAYFALAFGIKGLQLVSGSNSYWIQHGPHHRGGPRCAARSAAPPQARCHLVTPGPG
jgi:hypothetical protein